MQNVVTMRRGPADWIHSTELLHTGASNVSQYRSKVEQMKRLVYNNVGKMARNTGTDCLFGIPAMVSGCL